MDIDIADSIINGKSLSYEEALELCVSCPSEKLFEAADYVRGYFFSNKIETCSIVNARSGRCPENCKWCAQSAHHKTGAEVYPLMSGKEILEYAKVAESSGIGRFSIVTSGRSQEGGDFESICEAFKLMRAKTKIGLCGSLGLLDKARLKSLKEAGMTRYHCNLETAPSMFGKLCGTHTIEDKIRTIDQAKEHGIEICSGGIIGMGETTAQRVEFAVALREIGAISIPINILQPIKGTPLENAAPLGHDEILRTFAIFRLVNPVAQIRFAGGRVLMGALQEKALKCGVSAAIVGDMLTTVGSKVSEDFEMFRKLGYEC